MLAKVNSGTTIGLDPVLVEVEVSIDSSGFPSFTLVGLPDKAVEESKERVRAALKNSGADFPQKRITVNLAPADFPKEGPAFDLPIALGIILASGQISTDIRDSLFMGEISLDGSLRPTKGVLPAALLSKSLGLKRIFVPRENTSEASVVEGIEVYPIASFRELCLFLRGERKMAPSKVIRVEDLIAENASEVDFSDVKGQESAKRGLEIAAAGGHNILMKGPPGSGKTLLARAFPSIMPKLTLDEALEVTKIYSISGLLSSTTPIVVQRPFRSPHHTTSRVGLIGGGSNPLPGEVSLSHRGVLFADEFSEFPRNVLESLRQPIEDGWVTISRAAGRITYPSKFILIASQNPCPCGFFGDRKKACLCSSSSILRYQKRVSGPILDRIDIHLDVPAVDLTKLNDGSYRSEESQTVRERVQKARDIQTQRFRDTRLTCNAEMGSRALKDLCPLTDEARSFLGSLAISLDLSARSYHRLIKVARTIADLALSEELRKEHLSEAAQFRFREKTI